METLLRRYLWTVDLVAIASCAAILARAASVAIDLKTMGPPQPAPSLIREPAKPEEEPHPAKNPEAIVRRNIFCSSCPSLSTDGLANDSAAARSGEVRTTLPIVLLAIMDAPPPYQARWSMAVARDTEARSVGVFRLGDTVRGATVTGILNRRVYLDNHGRAEYLDLFEIERAVSSKAFPERSPDLNRQALDLDRGIKVVGEHRYEVQRGTLEAVIEDTGLLSRAGRAMPETRAGRVVGFRLFAVHPDGPLAKIGMRTGDVISAVNGLAITSPERVLEAYGKLKSASHFSVVVERNTQKIAHEYTIR